MSQPVRAGDVGDAARGDLNVQPVEDDLAEIRSAMANIVLDGRVLVLVPDHTRTFPHPDVLRLIAEEISSRVEEVNVMIALGTHPGLSAAEIDKLFDLPNQPRSADAVTILNHEWWNPAEIADFGVIPADEVETLSEGRLSIDVTVRLNRRLHEYDHLVVCGPVFPHEVAGFSGGNKYLVPGVAAREIIDVTHWIGALITSSAVIGRADTPVRRFIDRAVSLVPTVRHAICLVIDSGHRIQTFAGTPEDAFEAAARASAKAHIRRVAEPVERALAVLPEMYSELWVGAKGMYKLESVVADRGELVIAAPHLHEVSRAHGELIREIGYHVRDYFTAQWERFEHIPWGVLAHSTHLRGAGTYVDGVERSRIDVTLATGIPADECAALGLGYLDPTTVDVDEWRASGALVVDHAGEMLYILED